VLLDGAHGVVGSAKAIIIIIITFKFLYFQWFTVKNCGSISKLTRIKTVSSTQLSSRLWNWIVIISLCWPYWRLLEFTHWIFWGQERYSVSVVLRRLIQRRFHVKWSAWSLNSCLTLNAWNTQFRRQNHCGWMFARICRTGCFMELSRHRSVSCIVWLFKFDSRWILIFAMI